MFSFSSPVYLSTQRLKKAIDSLDKLSKPVEVSQKAVGTIQNKGGNGGNGGNGNSNNGNSNNGNSNNGNGNVETTPLCSLIKIPEDDDEYVNIKEEFINSIDMGLVKRGYDTIPSDLINRFSDLVYSIIEIMCEKEGPFIIDDYLNETFMPAVEANDISITKINKGDRKYINNFKIALNESILEKKGIFEDKYTPEWIIIRNVFDEMSKKIPKEEREEVKMTKEFLEKNLFPKIDKSKIDVAITDAQLITFNNIIISLFDLWENEEEIPDNFISDRKLDDFQLKTFLYYYDEILRIIDAEFIKGSSNEAAIKAGQAFFLYLKSLKTNDRVPSLIHRQLLSKENFMKYVMNPVENELKTKGLDIKNPEKNPKTPQYKKYYLLLLKIFEKWLANTKFKLSEFYDETNVIGIYRSNLNNSNKTIELTKENLTSKKDGGVFALISFLEAVHKHFLINNEYFQKNGKTDTLNFPFITYLDNVITELKEILPDYEGKGGAYKKSSNKILKTRKYSSVGRRMTRKFRR